MPPASRPANRRELARFWCQRHGRGLIFAAVVIGVTLAALLLAHADGGTSLHHLKTVEEAP
jgi:hypothetical protein